jgi:hypothetical protein
MEGLGGGCSIERTGPSRTSAITPTRGCGCVLNPGKLPRVARFPELSTASPAFGSRGPDRSRSDNSGGLRGEACRPSWVQPAPTTVGQREAHGRPRPGEGTGLARTHRAHTSDCTSDCRARSASRCEHQGRRTRTSRIVHSVQLASVTFAVIDRSIPAGRAVDPTVSPMDDGSTQKPEIWAFLGFSGASGRSLVQKLQRAFDGACPARPRAYTLRPRGA